MRTAKESLYIFGLYILAFCVQTGNISTLESGLLSLKKVSCNSHATDPHNSLRLHLKKKISPKGPGSGFLPCIKRADYSLEDSLGRGAVFKTDAVADLLSQTHIHLFGHTLCHRHGCHSTGLRAGHCLLCIAGSHPFKTPLWNLQQTESKNSKYFWTAPNQIQNQKGRKKLFIISLIYTSVLSDLLML